MVNKVLMMVMVLFSLSLMSGCETMKGVGKDLSKLGDKIEDAADQ